MIRRHGPQLALDLAGVTFFDCAGINVLLATRRRARLGHGWIRVTRASPPARRTISLPGLQEVSVVRPVARCLLEPAAVLMGLDHQ